MKSFTISERKCSRSLAPHCTETAEVWTAPRRLENTRSPEKTGASCTTLHRAASLCSEVPEVGLEPTRPCGHWILNLRKQHRGNTEPAFQIRCKSFHWVRDNEFIRCSRIVVSSALHGQCCPQFAPKESHLRIRIMPRDLTGVAKLRRCNWLSKGWQGSNLRTILAQQLTPQRQPSISKTPKRNRDY